MSDTDRWRFGRDVEEAAFVRRVLIAIAIGALAFLSWKLAGVVLLIFGAVLVAVILRAAADALARYTPIPERWSIAVATVLLFVTLVAILYLFGSQMRAQLANVAERLPAALNTFTQDLGLGDATGQLRNVMGAGPGGDLVGTVAGFGQTLLGGLADLLLVIAAGIYMAADPHLYRRGLVKLFPRSQHERIEDALILAGVSLRKWFGGQLVAMALVGTVSALLYWLIGLPAPLALGLIAGLTNFIPFLGPILGAVPAVLLAFTQDGDAVLWTVLAATAIQQLEGNLITPMVERRAVSLPPALALFAVITFGVLFGFLGLFLAVPLAVVLYVMVKKLYVRETLGEPTSVPGEDEARRSGDLHEASAAARTAEAAPTGPS